MARIRRTIGLCSKTPNAEALVQTGRNVRWPRPVLALWRFKFDHTQTQDCMTDRQAPALYKFS